jgi:hypothetical protein
MAHREGASSESKREPVQLETLTFFTGAGPSLASSERLVSASSIEARVEADRADACLAAKELMAMDKHLLGAKQQLDEMLLRAGTPLGETW